MTSGTRVRGRLLVVLLPVLLAGSAVAVLGVAWWPRPVSAALSGLPRHPVLDATARDRLTIRIAPTPATGADLAVRLDGRPVPVVHHGRALVVRPGRLPDGRHEVVVRMAGAGPFGRASVSRRTFLVDTLPPTVTLPQRIDATSPRGELTVRGAATGGVRVTVNGMAASVSGGRFEAHLPSPPARVEVVATDQAGNATRREAAVHVRHPAMRGVHLTALAWTAASLREPVLRMARDGRINAIELDIKDEDGVVGYHSRVPLARRTGAARGYYDARRVLAQLHALHVRVVGRIVAFRDPRLGTWAWRHGHRDWVIRTPGGGPYGGRYGRYSFTNPFNAQVRGYNVALAREAAGLGFDDILYDYVRRPDGDLRKLRFAGRHGSPESAIAGFMRESRDAVRAQGAFLGASVYGISATRPTQIAQDIPAMAANADYIAPMVYPSHWGRGEYGVANPNRAPYRIVRRSLADFQRLVRGSDTQIMPWLQDFSLGVQYGRAEVSAQIRAAHDAGSDSFLLWNAAARYTRAALAPRR